MTGQIKKKICSSHYIACLIRNNTAKNSSKSSGKYIDNITAFMIYTHKDIAVKGISL